MRFVKVYFRESMGSELIGKTVPFNLKNKENKQDTERKIFQENAKKVKELLNNYNSLDSLIKDDTKKGWKVKMELLNNNVITGSDCVGVVNVDNWKENYIEIKDKVLKDFGEQLGKYFSDDELKEFLLKKDKNGFIACNPVNLLDTLKDRGFSEEQVQKILFMTASIKQDITLKELFKYGIMPYDFKKGKVREKLKNIKGKDKEKITKLIGEYIKENKVKIISSDLFFGIKYFNELPNEIYLEHKEFTGKITDENKFFEVLKYMKEKNSGFNFGELEANFSKYINNNFYSSYSFMKKLYNFFGRKKFSNLEFVQNIDFSKLNDREKKVLYLCGKMI